jgi:hypothetical protein
MPLSSANHVAKSMNSSHKETLIKTVMQAKTGYLMRILYGSQSMKSHKHENPVRTSQTQHPDYLDTQQPYLGEGPKGHHKGRIRLAIIRKNFAKRKLLVCSKNMKSHEEISLRFQNHGNLIRNSHEIS